MLLLPILLSIVLFSPCSTTSDKSAEIVDAAVKSLTAASTGSADVLLALNLLGPQAALLMKVVVPIGAIVAEIGNPKPQSDEYKALMDLQNRTEEIWRDVQRRIEISTRAIGTRITMSHYTKAKRIPVQYMKRRTDKYIDPEVPKSDEDVAMYRRLCKSSRYAPLTILQSMRHHLVDNCKDAVTPTEAQSLAELRAYLMRVLLRLRVVKEPIPDPGLYFSEFSALYEQLDKDFPNEDLYVFSRYFSSYRKAVQAFFEELRNRASIEKVENVIKECLLRALILESNFNYPTIKAFALELNNQLIEVTFIAGICANVLYRDAESIDNYTKKIVDEVTLISSFASKWLNDSLISAWPSAHNQILKEQIQRIVPKAGYVDDRNLEIAADLTHPLLINTGLPNHVYEMLIVRAAEEEYEIYFEGMSNYCSLNKGAFGFDTVIGRIPLNSTNEQETYEIEGRMLRFSDDPDGLNITIQFEMNELYGAATLPLIADTLKKKIGKEFISEQDFHCWGIVREWSSWFFYTCPTIDYWSSPYSLVDLSSITTLSYENSGWPFQDCEEFRFFFFV